MTASREREKPEILRLYQGDPDFKPVAGKDAKFHRLEDFGISGFEISPRSTG